MDVTLLAGLAALAAAINSGLTVWNFVQSPSRKNAEQLARLTEAISDLAKTAARETKFVDDRVDEMVSRVNALEIVINQLPDRDSLHRLEMSLTTLSGQLNAMNTRLDPIDHLSRRLQEMLLEKSR